MNEIKWYDVAEQKPADGQQVLVMNTSKWNGKVTVAQAICTYKDGQFWNQTGISVTRGSGEEEEMVAKLECNMVYERVFAWADMAAINKGAEAIVKSHTWDEA